MGRASVTRLLDGAFGLGNPCRKLGTRQFEEQALCLESRSMGAAARRGRKSSIDQIDVSPRARGRDLIVEPEAFLLPRFSRISDRMSVSSELH